MRYTAFIATRDDFHGSPEDLAEAWQNDHPAVYHHDFDVPDGTPDRIVALIARGLFWEDQWTKDDTVSTVVEDLTPEDTRPLGHNPTESHAASGSLISEGVYRDQGMKDVDVWADPEPRPEPDQDRWDDKANW